MLHTFDGKAIKLKTPAKGWDKKSSLFRGVGVGFCIGIMFPVLCHC